MRRIDVKGAIHSRIDKLKGRLVLLLCRLYPIKKEKIFICNFLGLGFGDNPKAIAMELHKEMPSVDLVWAVRVFYSDMPSWIRQVRYESIRYYFEMGTSKIWIDNQRKMCHVLKRKGQFYIQTWHGMIGLKKVEGDSANALSPRYIAMAKHDTEMIDLFLTNGKFFTSLIRRAFWYQGELLQSGNPRVDVLFKRSDNKYQIHEYFKCDKNVAFVLYAPTFRKDGHNEYKLDFARVKVAIEERFGVVAKIIVRLHPAVATKNYNIPYGKDILNGTNYPDMYELMSECDFLISDYSSAMFDFGLMNKPVFVFATDIKDYLNDRGFYFTLQASPFPIAENNEELIRNITQYDHQKFLSDFDEFKKEYDFNESGKASEIVVDRIIQEINKEI